MTNDELLNAKDAAAAMKVSRKTLSAIIARGELQYFDLPRGHYIRRSEIERWIQTKVKGRGTLDES